MSNKWNRRHWLDRRCICNFLFSHLSVCTRTWRTVGNLRRMCYILLPRTLCKGCQLIAQDVKPLFWDHLTIFSERTTLRSLYAISRPSVVCLSVVCLWRWCTLLRQLNFSAIFFHHTIAQGLYFSGAKNRWWGTPLSPWNLRSKWPTPYSNSKISTNIGS